MEKKLKHILIKISEYIELVIAIMLTIALIVSLVLLFCDIKSFITGGISLNDTLEYALTIVVGIEFIKMLLKNTPGSVIELVLFAVARQVIISHSGALENLIGVLAVAVIFITWKFFFIPRFQEDNE